MPIAIGRTTSSYEQENNRIGTTVFGDFDPLVDISVTVEINKIRSLEKRDVQIPLNKKIDTNGNPDFYVKVIINQIKFTSPIWYDTKYVYNPEWSATGDVPDDVDSVNVTIELWDDNPSGDQLCDLSGSTEEEDDDDDDDDNDTSNGLQLFDNRFVVLQYDLKTGHWTGDDWLTGFWGGSDPNGYGRLNGCDDNSYDQNDRDCETRLDEKVPIGRHTYARKTAMDPGRAAKPERRWIVQPHPHIKLAARRLAGSGWGAGAQFLFQQLFRVGQSPAPGDSRQQSH